jgi:RNA polymerase sigma factor (sigma-70 family)
MNKGAVKMNNTEVTKVVQGLVELYLETGDKEIAGQVFDVLMQYEWKPSGQFDYNVRRLRGDRAEALSMYGEVFTRVIDKYKPEKPFINFINHAVKCASINASKKQGTYVKRYNPWDFTDYQTTDNAMEKYLEDYDGPTAAQLRETERLQKEAVADIMEKATEQEREILLTFIEQGSHGKTADQLGLNKAQVHRVVKRAKKYFDGDVEELLDTIGK